MTSFQITHLEKQVLYKKWVHLGFQPYEANQKIKNFCLFLKDLKIKLKKLKIPEEDIDTRFKKEFEKLCMRLDASKDYIESLKSK